MKKYHIFLLLLSAIILVWSLISPHDYFTWFLEVLPIFIGFPILAFTYRHFKLTDLLYALIALHAVVLMVGGHYTYAEVPLFNYLLDIGIFARNNYDKIGHFMQGFVPVILARELLLRTSPLRRGKWLIVLTVCVVMTISALYELFEWAVSLGTGSAGDSFLGTQGYVWDTQSDMFFALVGGVCGLILLQKWHDAQLKKMGV